MNHDFAPVDELVAEGRASIERITAGFRRTAVQEPQGEPTDAQVLAFMKTFWEKTFWEYAPPPGAESRVRAALRAAAQAGGV